MTDKPKPKRRWLQFSLRTMLLVVTVFCIWLGITAKRARDQKQAIATIMEMGGGIGFQHKVDNTEPPGPEWLRRLIAKRHCKRIEYLFTAIAPS